MSIFRETMLSMCHGMCMHLQEYEKCSKKFMPINKPKKGSISRKLKNPLQTETNVI